jgi:hypothetical protein
MRRLLIILLIVLALFAFFFYFFLGIQPQLTGEEGDSPTSTYIDSVIKNNKNEYPYVYLKGSGYVLKDRRIVFFEGEDTTKSRQEVAIQKIEEALESYWRWQIISGKKSFEELSLYNGKERQDTKIDKNIFSRVIDVFKVADAVRVQPDDKRTCACDSNLLMLAGPDLHLIQTTLNPGGGGEVTGNNTGSDETSVKNILESYLKFPQPDPQTGDGKSYDPVSFNIGIIDSGINYGLVAGQSSNPTFDYNFLTHSADVSDGGSITHGTYIASIVTKNAPVKGLKFAGLRTFDNLRIGNLYDNLCAILYCVKNNIKVVNASWGVHQNYPVFEAVMQKAKKANVTIVCSAGNESVDIDEKSWYPACYADHPDFGNNVISVTSKYGSKMCQNKSSSTKKIDLSVEADANCKYAIPDQNGNIGTINETGTSYAAPYVTAEVVKYKMSNPVFSKSAFITSLGASSTIKKYTN